MVNAHKRQTVTNEPGEDVSSLKKYLNSINPPVFVKEITTNPLEIASGGAGAEVEFRDVTGTVISNIGKTGLACEILCTADDAYYADALITFVWKSTVGVTTTSLISG